MKYHRSLRHDKQNKINKKCSNMRAAKKRKRLESEQPDYPLDRNELCYRHAVIFSEIGKPRKRVYELLKISETEKIQYWLYVNGRKAGQSTHRQLLTRIGKVDFPRIGWAI